MNSKSAVTILLLVFVAVSVGFLIAKESRKATGTNTESVKGAAPEVPPITMVNKEMPTTEEDKTSPGVSVAPGKDVPQKDPLPAAVRIEASAEEVSEPKVMVYYFHGNTRCYTCRTIESLAKEAVMSTFGPELKSGRVVFQSVNVEEPANEHFVYDYQLTTRSIVLARYSEGRQQSWKNLDRVWMLVRDSAAFYRYVADETSQMLGGA